MSILLARLLLIVSVALVPALGFQAYTESEARRIRQQLVQDEAVRLLRLVSAEQQRIAEGAEQVLHTIGGSPAVQDNQSGPCQRLLTNVVRQSPRYNAAAVIGLDGHILCASGLVEHGADLSDRSYFRRAVATGGFVIGDYAIGRSSGRPSIHMAEPYRDHEGKVAGVVELGLDVEWLGQQLARLPLPPEAAASVADRNGTILARFPDGARFVGRPIPAADRYSLEGDEVRVAPMMSLDGRQRVAAYSPTGADPKGLRIWVGLDREVTFAAVTQANRTGLLLIIAGGGLALLLTVLLGSRLIRRPVERLLGIADRWRTGDLAARTGMPAGGNEFGRLAGAFDSMAAALQAREQALRMALESTTDSVMVVDRAWRFTYLNAHAKAHLPNDRDVLGQVAWEAFPATADSPFTRAFFEAMERGVPTQVSGWSYMFQGYFEAHAYPSSDGLTLFFRDVTEERRIGAALQISEQLFRATFEQAAVGMAVVGLDGSWLQVNDKLCAITGYTREEMLAGRFQDITHPDDLEADLRQMQALLAGEIAVQTTEKRYLRKDGGVGWVTITASVLHETEHAPARLIVVIEDITARKRVEAALQESERLFRAMFEQAAVGMEIASLENGWLRMNDRLCAITGYTREEMFGRSALEITHPDDVEATRRQVEAVAAGTSPVHKLEKRYLRKDGSTVWVNVTVSLLRDAEGRPDRLIGVVEDISVRKRVETALHASEVRLQLAREAAGFGVWEWDIATGAVTWTEEQWRLHGYDGPRPEKLDVATWSDRVHPDDLERVWAGQRAIIASPGLTYDAEYRVLLPGGEVRWLLARAKVVRDVDGRPLRMVGLNMDVTASRETEAALRRLTEDLEARVREEVAAREAAQMRAAHAERLQALGQLAGGIAHDFNNVLQAVAGAAALIERRPADEAGVRRLARLAITATERGASITGRLLAFGRRADLRAERLDAASLLADLHDLLARTLGARIEVHVKAAADLPPVLADKGQLETVLVNLATNARDAMPEGGQLTLSAAAETVPADGSRHPAGLAPGRYVRFCVADAGVGMDAAMLARATEPFFTTKQAGSGTGLGLSMAKGFAEQSGGALRIDSAPGEGTRVTMWLPASASGSQADVVAEQTAITRKPAKPVRVLVVDDEDLVREILAECLEQAGFDVLVAATGAAALDLLAAGEAVDILVTDLSMPNMDGLAVIRAAQELRRGLPAVLMTGYARDECVLPGGDAASGAFSLLRKPVTSAQLIDLLNALLAGRTVAARSAAD